MKLRSMPLITTIVFLLAHGVFRGGTDGLSAFVMDGDSVALHTNVETKQQEVIKWHYKDTRIAQIAGDLSFICTDVQCNGGTERFRERLELDNKTGTLTIRDTRTTDSGLYELKIFSSRYTTEKTFNVTIRGVSAAERDEMRRKSLMEGESVTLDPAVTKNPNDVMVWYFNDICIAGINEEPRMICTDVQCNNSTERFRDRLKLDHQTGSLTIMNIRTTDSGEYTLQISNSRFSITRSFSVTVTGLGLSAGQIAGICAAALLLIGATVCVLFYQHRVRKRDTKMKDSSQVNGVHDLWPDHSDSPLMDDFKESSFNHTMLERTLLITLRSSPRLPVRFNFFFQNCKVFSGQY
ncbi:uncharacterized protein LOC122327411 isoform X2 [Puntigrus tetrazona]|uniref:uncharacterized protein LOC122327411 isoform X2 n=1 Tax=Puntigrus tetrazona TaxID=1606681 RepID=UPI001C89D279|nr:uncharacterized protein LOC122327411 isoform X2 [Puntigrus tetrazona]